MLQVIKAKVNGKDGFICTVQADPRQKPETIAFNTKEEVLALLDELK